MLTNAHTRSEIDRHNMIRYNSLYKSERNYVLLCRSVRFQGLSLDNDTTIMIMARKSGFIFERIVIHRARIIRSNIRQKWGHPWWLCTNQSNAFLICQRVVFKF